MISPLLALLYMRRFLLARQQRWEQRLQAPVQAYADDLVILCRGTAAEALTATRDLMRRTKLELNGEKTRIVYARKECFGFLGYTFGAMYNPKNGARYLGAAPSRARVRRLRQEVHRYLSPHNQSPVDEVIAHFNRLFDYTRGAAALHTPSLSPVGRWCPTACLTSLSLSSRG